MLPVLAASPWECQQPRTPTMLMFSHTSPNQGKPEVTNFTYKPPAVPCVMTDLYGN